MQQPLDRTLSLSRTKQCRSMADTVSFRKVDYRGNPDASRRAMPINQVAINAHRRAAC
jgi:hypothetical protein